MLDIAWPELLVIGAVALVAIGPKDMPRVMHGLGRWAGRTRLIARDLRRTFEQLEYEAEIADKLNKQEGNSGRVTPEPAQNANLLKDRERQTQHDDRT